MKHVLMYKKQEAEAGGTVQTKKPLRIKVNGSKDDIGRAVNAFLAGEVGKFGKYVAVKNALVYRSIITNDKTSDFQVAENVCAVRLESGLILGNASILPLIGRTVLFGNESINRFVAEVQVRLGQVVPMLPFNVFQEAGLSISRVRIVEQGIEEQVIRKVPNPKHNEYGTKAEKSAPKFIEEQVHFTGSKLFETDGVQFLFDVDREELRHKLFNPFLVKLPRSVANIQEAYDALKPQEVKDAEAKGLKVIRQGEWFFIQSDANPNDKNATDKIGFEKSRESWRRERFELRAGRNRPNYATKGFKIGQDSYVSGLVEHSGREHRTIILDSWFKVVPNTAVESFTITGDVD